MRLGRRFVDAVGLRLAHDRLELFLRARQIAGEKQRGAELVMQRAAERRVLVRQRHALPEKFHRRLPVARLKRLDAAQFIRQAAFKQQIHVLLPRIGHGQIAIAPLADMWPRLLYLSEPAVRGRQRRMQAFGLGIHRQRVFQIFHGAGIVALRHRHAAEPGDDGDGAWGERIGLGEQRFGGVCLALREIQSTEPDESGDIVRLQFERALECRFSFVRFAAAFVEVREVIRPTHVIRIERLRVQIARLGDVELLSRLKHHAVLSVRARGLRLLKRLVPLAYLYLHARIDTGQIGQRDRQQLGTWRRAGDRRGERADAGHGRERPHFEPDPSTSVV